MSLAPTYRRASLSYLSGLGILTFLCCLLCAPFSAEADAIMPPPLHLWEVPSEADPPPAPCALLPHFSHLLRPSLGQGQSAETLENSQQRKKKKKLSAHDQRHLVFMAWLAAFSLPPSSVHDDAPAPVEREDIPCLPSWRGFVFFPLPPPLFS